MEKEKEIKCYHDLLLVLRYELILVGFFTKYVDQFFAVFVSGRVLIP
jgi:hypothetical protein